MRAFKHNVITAEGHKAHIIGIKKCKIKLGEWIFVADVLVSNNLIKTCIIGMDILSICPPTQKVIQEFEKIIEDCTKIVREHRKLDHNKQMFNLNNAIFSGKVKLLLNLLTGQLDFL